MKKLFPLKLDNKHPDRVLEGIKYEIRKYMKRERKKKLPEDATFWDFDCRAGKSGDEAESMSANEIITALDKASEAGWDACYIEILAKPVQKARAKPSEDAEEAETESPAE